MRKIHFSVGANTIQTLKAWREKKPELFVKRVYEQAELDTYAGSVLPAWALVAKAANDALVIVSVLQDARKVVMRSSICEFGSAMVCH